MLVRVEKQAINAERTGRYLTGPTYICPKTDTVRFNPNYILFFWPSLRRIQFIDKTELWLNEGWEYDPEHGLVKKVDEDD